MTPTWIQSHRTCFWKILCNFLPPCSGCFCSSIHHGTVPLSSFWPMLTRGSANAGQVPSGRTVENKYLNMYCVIVCLISSNALVCLADLCEKEPFLSTEEGVPFRTVFKYVRLQYIINDLASARILERDNILPPGKTRWNEMMNLLFSLALEEITELANCWNDTCMWF